MMRVAIAAGVMVSALCWSAGAQTVYTDYASWVAATAGDTHAAYSGAAVQTLQLFKSVAAGGCAFPITGPTPSSSPTDFSSIGASPFNFSGDCNEAVGTVEIAPLEIDIHFDHPIDGFFGIASAAGYNVLINGVGLPYAPAPYEFGFVQSGITDLAFVNGAGATDNDDSFYISDIVVATPIPEPATIALLGGALLGLAASRRQLRPRLRS